MSESNEVKTFVCQIYIAGDLNVARKVCREYCMAVGLCVTIENIEFIYTGGSELGIKIGLINYPRFPDTIDNIRSKANVLAEILRKELCQHSYSIVDTEKTNWLSNRAQ